MAKRLLQLQKRILIFAYSFQEIPNHVVFLHIINEKITVYVTFCILFTSNMLKAVLIVYEL